MTFVCLLGIVASYTVVPWLRRLSSAKISNAGFATANDAFRVLKTDALVISVLAKMWLIVSESIFL